MSGFIGRTVGAKGCFLQVGAGTITPPHGAKITAVGIHATAVITNYKYTPDGANSTLSEITKTTGNGWLGVSLEVTGPSSYIPLGDEGNSMAVASGSVFAYFD